MEILKVDNISKTYGKDENLVKALDGVSFPWRKASLLPLLGHQARENPRSCISWAGGYAHLWPCLCGW